MSHLQLTTNQASGMEPRGSSQQHTGPTIELPIANVSRLMRQSLLANHKLSAGSKTMMQECVQEFIAFITCEAQERADGQRRSTLNGDDVLHALTVLGFDEYAKMGKIWLSRYRTVSSEAACGLLLSGRACYLTTRGRWTIAPNGRHKRLNKQRPKAKLKNDERSLSVSSRAITPCDICHFDQALFALRNALHLLDDEEFHVLRPRPSTGCWY